MTQSPTVAVIVAAWEPDRTFDVLRRVRAALGGPGVARTVVVANRPEATRDIDASQVTQVVAGSNVDAEFSAYDEGLDVIRGWTLAPDVLIVANDRALSYPSPNLRLCEPRTLSNVHKYGVATGRVDRLPRPMEVMETTVHAYIRSNFMALPFSALRPSFRFSAVGDDEYEEIAPRNFTGSWITSPRLEPGYRDFLRQWLTGTEGIRWYGAVDLDSSSWPMLRSKVKSILNEQMLSARLRDLGLPLLSYDQSRRPIRKARQVERLARVAPYFEYSRVERSRWAVVSRLCSVLPSGE